MSNAWVTARTDGSASLAGDVGAWAFILEFNGNKLLRGERVREETSGNRMEMRAAIEALKAIKDGSRVAIYTDSQYLAFSMTKGWKRNKNSDLWYEITEQVCRMEAVEWNWVPREINAEADKLAGSAMRKGFIKVRIGPKKQAVRRSIYHLDLASGPPPT